MSKHNYCILIFMLLNNVISNFKISKNDILEKLIDQPRELFKAYYKLFEKDKEYNIISVEVETKYEIFLKNVEFIKNKNKEIGAKIYGFTKFTDMTNEEFQERYLMKIKKSEKKNQAISRQSELLKNKNIKYPEIDWRSKMNTVKDQENCGASWAFAAIALVEGNYNIKFEKLLNLSEQYLIDCTFENFGCNSGSTSESLYNIKYGGVQEAISKPYKADTTYCATSDKEIALNIVDKVEHCDYIIGDRQVCDEDLWLSMLSKGPIASLMDGSSSTFAHYSPSTPDQYWNPNEGDCKNLNLAVTIVGIKFINDKPHIIGRNSWGTDWGNEGYFFIPADNHCFIMNHGYTVEVQEPKPFEKQLEGTQFFKTCDLQEKAFISRYGFPNALESLGGTIKGWLPVRDSDAFLLYTEANCEGEEQLVHSNIPTRCFKDNSLFKHKEFMSASIFMIDYYFKANNGCIILFELPCYVGNYFRSCSSISNLGDVDFNFSKVGSMIIGGNVKNPTSKFSFTAFEDIGFNGFAYTFEIYGETGKYPNAKSIGERFISALSKAKSFGIISHLFSS